LCIFAPNPVTREMIVISIHAGVTREQIAANTGWEVRYATNAGVTPPPTREELQVLRELHERTRAAHA
jgi:glutaconate CoA-transferase subunit B